jgi:cytochrome P450
VIISKKSESLYRTLIFAAQDTTASALSRALHTLAIHTDAQERLREEIRQARGRDGGAWGEHHHEREHNYNYDYDYDKLENLKYLDAVCRETLRLYAPVSWLWRVYVLFNLNFTHPL